MKCYHLLLFLAVITLTHSTNIQNFDKRGVPPAPSCDCHPVIKQFNTTITGSVNKKCRLCYLFSYDFSKDQKWAARVCVKSPQATEHTPLLIIVMESIGVRSFQLPVVFEEDVSVPANTVCHTLCPLTNYFDANVTVGEQTIKVQLTTSSPQALPYELIVNKVDKFVIQMNESISINVTSSAPRVLQYDMSPGIGAMQIEAESTDSTCAILAIQDIECPFYDTERTIRQKGYYQTFTRQSSISITRKEFVDGRVYAVLYLLPTDTSCVERKGTAVYRAEGYEVERSKEITLRAVPPITGTEFNIAVYGILGGYIAFFVVSILICAFASGYSYRQGRNLSIRLIVDEQNPSLQSYGTVSGEDVSINQGQNHSDSVCNKFKAWLVSRPANNENVSLPQFDAHISSSTSMQPVVRVCDLFETDDDHMKERATLYAWNLVVVGIFYGLPVVQLVFIHQKIVNITGNQDLCYYNFLCAHRVGVFSDFNHIYSNIGYVMLGFLFMMIVWLREKRYQNECSRNSITHTRGIPAHFGLLYAMGWALIMEGVLSASYHVCPSKANFQFDTAFMYVISTICMMKLYHARHPDISARSHTTWMFLAVLLCIVVFGVLQGRLVAWILFVILHLLVTVMVGTSIYYIGTWKLDKFKFIRVNYHSPHNECRPRYVGRFAPILVIVLLNIALDLYGLIEQPEDFAGFVLGAFIMNLILYLLYYTSMKIYCKEKIGWLPIVCMLFSFICWGPALYYFFAGNTTWQETPAQSRERNVQCIAFGFFDEHDVWHFLSSFALFFSFLVMLTIDDDLDTKSHTSIIVF